VFFSYCSLFLCRDRIRWRLHLSIRRFANREDESKLRRIQLKPNKPFWVVFHFCLCKCLSLSLLDGNVRWVHSVSWCYFQEGATALFIASRLGYVGVADCLMAHPNIKINLKDRVCY
jgi:hypothetical protein